MLKIYEKTYKTIFQQYQIESTRHALIQSESAPNYTHA